VMRCTPCQPHRRHQPRRNRFSSRIRRPGSTRTVSASHCGQRTPSGRIQRKTTVAAIPRNTKSPPKTSTNHAASDISRSPPSGVSTAQPALSTTSDRTATIGQIARRARETIDFLCQREPRLDCRPRLDEGHAILPAFRAHLDSASKPGTIRTARRNRLVRSRRTRSRYTRSRYTRRRRTVAAAPRRTRIILRRQPESLSSPWSERPASPGLHRTHGHAPAPPHAKPKSRRSNRRPPQR